MPRSLQKATRWLDGIAIGTQHKKDAAHSNPCTLLAGSRNPWVPRKTPALVPAARPGCGAGRRNIAIGTISTTTTAKASIVRCQPSPESACWNTVGQTTPAMYWPDEIKASAVPRRRSNQRLI